MANEKITEEQKREKIQQALESINLHDLPPEITSLLEYFTRLTADDEFIEKLNQEIFKKYGG